MGYMKTIIISLAYAIKTGLKDADLLEKQDKIIFLYGKGKDTISIGVHNALNQIKCKTEFFEIPDQDLTEDKMDIYYAFFAGKNPDVVIVCDKKVSHIGEYHLGITVHESFTSLSQRKRNSDETKRGRKKSLNTQPFEEQSKVISVESSGTKEATVKKAASGSDTGKTVIPTKTSKDDHSMAEFTDYLKQISTKENRLESFPMTIFQALCLMINSKLTLRESLEQTLYLEEKVNAAEKGLQGHTDKLLEITKQILKEKEANKCH